MAKTNSTPKGNVANRKGANQKKQKIIVEKKSELQQRQSKHNLNAGAKKEQASKGLKQRQTLHNLNESAKKDVKTPSVKNIELSQEDIFNNIFEGMAVSIAYAKNEAEKQKAVETFAAALSKIPADQQETIKTMIVNRLREDDFIYGSEFIDLTGLRQYQNKMFEPRRVQKEFEKQSSALEDKQPKVQEKPLKRPNPNRKQEQDLYQALVDGINNEEIKNIKGYSQEDLKKILAYHDNLLDGTDGNGTAFESLYENSISDLKKFANGDMMVDNDSYETMLQFIKTFGTNSKGDLTPEGKAAYDKLMGLMAEAQKDKIRKNKEQYQQQTENEQKNKNRVIGGILTGLKENAEKRKPEDEFAIGLKDNTAGNANINSNKGENNNNQENTGTTIIPTPTGNGNNGNGSNGNTGGNSGNIGGNNTNTPNAVQDGSSNTPVNPPLNLPESQLNKDNTKDKNNKPKGFWGRVKDWGKRNWKKLVAAAAVVGGLLLLKNCNGDGKPIAPRPGNNDGNGNKPDTTIVAKPDTITLDANDLSNGFYLERSAGFKAEQEKINFNDAEKANKVDLLTVKKLIAHKELEIDKFVRHDTTTTKEPVTVAEIAYKMRIVTQNFPKSKMAKSVENMFAGKITNQDRANIYAAFNHIDDFGNLINGQGKIVDGIPGKKEIDKTRMGPGSKEYGTEGTANNFLQVLKNQRNSHSK